MTPPSPEVLTHFGVRLITSLGGRVNQHWLVEAAGEKLVLRHWGQSPLYGTAEHHAASVQYEVRLMACLAAQGWPVAAVVAGPAEIAGRLWSLAPFLPGGINVAHGARDEQRARGRLLAELHAGMAQLPELGPRPGWRRGDEVLADPALDATLAGNEQAHPEKVRILRWHLDRARVWVAGLTLYTRPGQIVHGDFTPWNLRSVDGRLSGILDFELAHWDHRVADFALSWRGKYDDVIHGYNEVSPLDPDEWALITPLWWALLIQVACRDLELGVSSDGWAIDKLLLRSPVMGQDAEEYKV